MTPTQTNVGAAVDEEPHDWLDEDPAGYDDVDSLLGAAIPTISWKDSKPGDSIEGFIVTSAAGVQTKMDTGEVLTFDDGSPRPQVVITLQTKLGDGGDDDGRRRLFVKGQMMKAFKEAIKAAHAPGPRPGGKVIVTYTGDGVAKGKGFNAPKLFSVVYGRP